MRRTNITITGVQPGDAAVWASMRQSLWPSAPGEHAAEIAAYFRGNPRNPAEVFLAYDEAGHAIGFVELSIRNYAEGCHSDRVAYIEGWYVSPDARRRGVGAALVAHSEAWGQAGQSRQRGGASSIGFRRSCANDLFPEAADAIGVENMTQAEIVAISPFFIVRHVPSALAFYRDRLGFEITFQGPNPDDIFFGIVRRGGAQILMKAVGVAPQPNPTRDINQGIARWDAFVDVPDPDALAFEYASRNVEFVEPLEDTDDGLRGFALKDSDGYVLFFGRPR